MLKQVLGIFIVALMCSVAGADVYTDTNGDVEVEASGWPHVDITSVTVTNDGTNLNFNVTMAGDISTATGTDWGKYMIGIDSPNQAGGDTTGNGWGRPINFDGTSTSGMDFWAGTWVDSGGGGQLFDFSTGAWVEIGSNIITPDLSNANLGTTSFSLSLSDLGLSVGDTIIFDVYSSGGGGGDGAWDALSDPNASVPLDGFGDAYTSYGAGQNLLTYTITGAVPEPGSLALLTLFGTAMLARRRR